MHLLKRLPISYTAHLKDIRLINFSVHPEELSLCLPNLPLLKINGNPVVSLLDVKLEELRPSFLLNTVGFTYHHIAFRILVRDDHLHTDKINRGFFYLYSFTDNSFIATCGKLFTNFNFAHARIHRENNDCSLHFKKKYLKYSFDFEQSVNDHGDLKKMLMQIDRAYSLNDARLKVTKVNRTSLPLEPVNCSHFVTNFFSTAKLLGAFFVKEPLHYEWLPPKNCLL